MEKKYKVIITLCNWDGGNVERSTDVTEDEFNKFRPIMKVINDKCPSNTWNWFESIPLIWNGDSKCYKYDKWRIKDSFDSWFGSSHKLTADDVIAFYEKFTPRGADGIEKIEVFKCEKVSL